MSDRILKLTAGVFLGRIQPSEDQLEDLVARLLDIPRYRSLDDQEIELLERRPRALAEKLLDHFVMGSKYSHKSLQTFAREILDGDRETAQVPMIPLQPLNVPDDMPTSLTILPGLQHNVRITMGYRQLNPFRVRLPRDILDTLLRANVGMVVIQIQFEDGSFLYARPDAEPTYDYEIELDANTWSAYKNQTARVQMVTDLKMAHSIELDINLESDANYSMYREQIEEILKDAPALYLGQRLTVDTQRGVQVMVTRMHPDNERVLAMPPFSSEITYSVRNRKFVPMQVTQCIGCHETGQVKLMERNLYHRVFCSKECQRVYYL